MTTEELLSFAKENNFRQITPKGVAGIWDDFVVLATSQNNGVGVTISSTAQAGDKKSLQAVNKLIKAYGIIVGGWNDKRVFFLLKEKDLKTRSLGEYLDIFTRNLRSAKVYPSLGCSVCGKQGSDVLAIHGDEYARAHESCIRDEVKRLEIRLVNDNKEKKSNYLPGITGALVGMFIGLVANMFLVWLSQGEQNIIGFMLVPLFSYMMYRKYAGETSNVTLIASALTSVYGAYFMYSFSYAMKMWMTDSRGFADALNSILTTLFTPSGFVQITRGCVLYFGATVFTLYFANKFLKTAKKPAVITKDILSTMVKL